MKTVDLEYLELENFRSFVEPTRIPLGSRGLVLIKGVNKNTNGSSGAGKSSLNLGIAYALGYSPFPATELQSWLTDESLRVTLGFRIDSTRAVISRGPRTRLEVDGNAVGGGNKNAEAELQKLLGLTPDMLEALTYRQQRSDGTFLSKTNVKIQEFLTSVLGLGVYEDAVSTGQKKIKAAEDSCIRLQQNHEYHRLELLGLQDALEVKMKTGVFTTVPVQDLEAAAAAAAAAVKYWQNIRSTVSTRFCEYQLEFSKSVENAVAAADMERHALVDSHLVAAREVAESMAIQDRLDSLRAEAQKPVSEDKCPTCDRPWDSGDQHRLKHERRRAALLAEVQDLEKRLHDRIGAKARVDELKSLIKDAENRVAAARAQASEVFRSNLEALRRAAAAAEDNWTKAMGVEREARRALESALDTNARATRELQSAREQILDRKKKLEDALQAWNDAKTVLAQEQDFVALVGREGFLGAIFDEVLAEVADETNAILAKVPNVQDVTLAFKSESVTDKGTTKKAIVPVVSVRGHEAQLKSGCSGGMLGAVYLATDLAVIDVVSRRLGVSPGWLVLDESFDGLGAVEKEAYLEVLSTYAQKKLVLVVDHGTETKEYFQNCIELIFENEHTTVVQPK